MSGTARIQNIHFRRFRSFQDISIQGLGRVNLITGRNNTGKSSILEGLRILTQNADVNIISKILQFREEDINQNEEDASVSSNEGLFQLSTLFHGFPQLEDSMEPIVLKASGEKYSKNLTMTIDWFSEESNGEGGRRLVHFEPDMFGEPDGIPALSITIGNHRRDILLSSFRRFAAYRERVRPDLFDEPKIECQFVSPYGGERTAPLGLLWDRIALSDKEKDVVEALQIIDSNISAVSMVGGEGRRSSRTAIVRAKNLQRPVPLRSYGDGLNRLFGIILSLVNSSGGLLLIDEFENGMHYSVQLDTWRAIFKLARNLDIQVFATSHSWDAIEAFQKAASETPEDGVLIRLARKNDLIIPTVFSEEELEIATREGIEVR